MYNIEEALHMEELRDNENSFYDVFEEYDEEDIIEYKRLTGIPITDGDD